MQRLRAVLLACALVLLAAQSGAAAGFGIYEWSARGNALGGATVGRGDDPSAIASNPAGITQLDGIRVLGGVTFIHPVVDVRTNNPMDHLGRERLVGSAAFLRHSQAQ